MELKGTKNELQMFLNDLYAPLESRFTSGCAGIDMGATGSIYNEATALMEAFARPLWGLVPHASGEGRVRFGRSSSRGSSMGLTLNMKNTGVNSQPKTSVWWNKLCWDWGLLLRRISCGSR